jgi:hypothetical protein
MDTVFFYLLDPKCLMVQISRFLGIIISMYYQDQNPPHFHAEYDGKEIRVEIETLSILR